MGPIDEPALDAQRTSALHSARAARNNSPRPGPVSSDLSDWPVTPRSHTQRGFGTQQYEAASTGATFAGRRRVLHEVNAFALIGRRQAAATAAAHHACASHLYAGVGARAEHRAALERSDRLTTQQTGQLYPLGASDSGAAFDEFGRHLTHTVPAAAWPGSQATPYCPPDLGTGSIVEYKHAHNG